MLKEALIALVALVVQIALVVLGLLFVVRPIAWMIVDWIER